MTTFGDFCKQLWGPKFKPWPEYGNESMFLCGLFPEYYIKPQSIPRGTARKLMRGVEPLSKELCNTYTPKKQTYKIEKKIRRFVAVAISIHRLRCCCRTVCNWAYESIDDTGVCALVEDYLSSPETHDDITRLLSGILHYTLCVDSRRKSQ